MSNQRKASQPPKADDDKRGGPADMVGLKTRAMFKPGTLNEDERTVEVVFGSDKPVRMSTWEYGYINEELSFDPAHIRMDRLNSGAPVLDNHDAYGSVLDTVVGVVERAWSDGKKGYAKLRFAKTDKAEKLLDMARDGILQNVSVGYSVHKYIRTKATEKGQLDHYKAVEWEPHEISMVSIPADYDAKVRSLTASDHEVNIEDATPGPADTQTRDYGETAVMETGEGGAIEFCTEAINEINETVTESAAMAQMVAGYAENDPENADAYAEAAAAISGIADAAKAAIEKMAGIISTVNGSRSAAPTDDKNDILNQRSRELALLKARF